MSKKSYIKILPLEYWQKFMANCFEQDESDSYPEIKPVFNREGQYFDRKTKECWFEVDGKAYLNKNNLFGYELQLLNHTPLTQSELEAFRLLKTNRFKFPRKLKDLLYMDECWKSHRETYRGSRKATMKALRE